MARNPDDLENGSEPPTQNPKASATIGSVTTNLAQLLPTGTVFAFQSLLPSFSNHGTCHTANKYLTVALIGLCTLACCLFSFTDSYIGGKDGNTIYFGFATWQGLYIFDDDERDEFLKKPNANGNEATGASAKPDTSWLKKFAIRPRDIVHAAFSCLLFLSIAFADATVQECLLPSSRESTRDFLVNLPLGFVFSSSVVFMIFPTTRKGIGYSGTLPRPLNLNPRSENH
ncbi:PREDICTED: uncharacterized protein LOC109115554 [Nelumbo nucifera]|uniref:Uncharacterized protein n=2 Tax=Nelumbo nucifera TaxID=4432 RepID=A0A822ZPE0_NELNU|nr:PREDICTED: uncharacterized protein LOC109115554 [Nelumbo nucifera]DAD45401.1 TPA_asm: hypothetical protein HUJ06_003631 [Nelumbo nucifera]